VQSRDHWYGVYTDGTRPNISTDTASNVMNADSSDGATIENVHIAGGQYTPGTVKSGRGISEGQNLTVKNIKASYNENQGIGGTASNLRVYDSVFDHNGNADSSYLAGSQTSSAGIKSVNSTFIYNSRFEDNFWNGAWCDLECGQFEIHDSVFLRNGKAGFHYEVSSGPAIFEGNTVQDNGYLAEANRHVGLLVVSSRNLQAYGNTFGGNRDWGAQFIEDSRDPVTGNINFYNNTMNGDPIQRCGQNGVTCSNNTAN
jgi:hypothetical protein